jgi:hypothetical protein
MSTTNFALMRRRTDDGAGKRFAPAPTLLQRQCACGGHLPGGAKCHACGKGKMQAKLAVGASDDALEVEADRVADQVLGGMKPAVGSVAAPRIQRLSASSSVANEAPASVEQALAGAGRPLEPKILHDMEQGFRHDFSGVRLHSGDAAEHSAGEVQARAYTVGRDIVFGAGQYAPETQAGRRLLAHELAHVVQQTGPRRIAGPVVQRDGFGDLHLAEAGIKPPTKGDVMMNSANVWLETDAAIKNDLDVLKSALKEIAQGTKLDYNRAAGKTRIASAGGRAGLDQKAIDAVDADWDWLVDKHKSAKTPEYQKKTAALFQSLQSPLKKAGEPFPKSQAKYWLKNTPPQVANLMYQVADAELPVDQLYVYAEREGLVDYVRDQLGMSAGQDPGKAQLGTFDTAKPVSGFNYLGADDFMTELNAKRQPLSAILPSGLDMTKVKESAHINEKNRPVRSADFPNLLSALMGFAAMVKRRRRLFLEDAKQNGYATPSTDELVYWTYVYFNAGEFGGKAQLEKYKGKRKLGDWIKADEYEHSIKVLQSYQMLKSMDQKMRIF